MNVPLCMLIDCVPGDVLLKKSQYSSCPIVILATNIAENGCDHAVDIKFSRFMYRQKMLLQLQTRWHPNVLVASAADYSSQFAYYSKTF